MKLGYKIAILTAVGVGIVGVSSYFNRQMNLLRDACYTLAGAMINEISFSKVSFTMILSISNKSDIDFTITGQEYNIYVNSMLVATINNPEIVKVLARGRSTVNIAVSFNPQDLLKQGMQNIAALIGDKDSMVIEIKGYLSLNSGIVSIKDYKVDERLTMKELLSDISKPEKC